MSPSELWQRILAAPADPELKTQYVEALTQAGDPHAEIFTLATEYKRLRSGSYIDAAKALKPRLDALLATWRAEFAPRADAWPGEIQFVIGWPIELTITAGAFAHNAAEIVAAAPVRHLNLTAVSELPAVFDVPQFDQIVSLDGSRQTWSDDAVRALANSAHTGALRWLDLSRGGITEAQVEMLAASSALRGVQMLDLSNNPARDPVDASAGSGVYWETNRIIPDSVFLPDYGTELEARLRQDRMAARLGELSGRLSAEPVYVLAHILRRDYRRAPVRGVPIYAAMSSRVARFFMGAAMVVLSACGGGSAPSAPAPTPSPTPSFTVSTFASGTVGPAGPTPLQFPSIAGSISGTVTLPPATATATVSMTFSNAARTGLPAVQVGAPVTVLAYMTATSSATTHFATSIGVSVAIPGVTIVSGNQYLLLSDPTNPAAGWIAISGAGSPSTGPLEGENKGALTLQQGVPYDLVLVTTQGTLTVAP